MVAHSHSTSIQMMNVKKNVCCLVVVHEKGEEQNPKEKSWHKMPGTTSARTYHKLRHAGPSNGCQGIRLGLEVKNKTQQLELSGHLQEALDLPLEIPVIMTNNFPSFLDTSPGTGGSGRLAPLPIPQQQQQQQQQNNNNGNGAAMNGIPMAAGQQADVNFLFQKLVELSEVLKDNREKTAGIIAGAEELAVSNSTRRRKVFTIAE